MLAALAAELATSPWADDLQVTVVGCLPSLPAALGAGRVRHLPTLDLLLPPWNSRPPTCARRWQHTTCATCSRPVPPVPTNTCRATPGPPSWCSSAAPSSPTAAADSRQCCTSSRVSIAAVTTDAVTITPWQLQLGANNPSPDALAVLAPLGLTLRPQQLTAADLEQLLGLLVTADQPATAPPTPPGSSELVTDEPTVAELGSNLVGTALPEPATDATPAEPVTPTDEPRESARPLVQILGPVDVLHPRGQIEPSKRRQLTEIAAFLALYPGADHHGLSEAIWPGARAVENTRNTALSKLRKWLGSSDDGTDYVPPRRQ